MFLPVLRAYTFCSYLSISLFFSRVFFRPVNITLYANLKRESSCEVIKKRKRFSPVNEAGRFRVFPAMTSYTAQLNRKCGVPREKEARLRINEQRAATAAAAAAP